MPRVIPYNNLLLCIKCDYIQYKHCICELISVDNLVKCGIINFTLNSRSCLGYKGERAVSQKAKFTKSAPSKGTGRNIQNKRVLRCKGSGSGQVRNAKTSSAKRNVGHTSFSSFRIHSSCFLSVFGSIRTRGDFGVVSTEDWSQESSQTYGNSIKLHQDSTKRREGKQFFSVSQCRATAVWTTSPSKKHRTCADSEREKKDYRKVDATSSGDIDMMVVCYEKLRSNALGKSMGSHYSRSEMNVFLQRGMASWYGTFKQVSYHRSEQTINREECSKVSSNSTSIGMGEQISEILLSMIFSHRLEVFK